MNRNGPDLTIVTATERQQAQRGPRMAVINGVRCDPTTAEQVLTRNGGGPVMYAHELHRFDEVLYRNDAGYWFIVRPLDPEEAQEWIEGVDQVCAQQLFPDAE